MLVDQKPEKQQHLLFYVLQKEVPSNLLISSGTDQKPYHHICQSINLSIKILDKFHIPFDLVGDKPTGLIIVLISSIDNFIIS